MRRYFVICPALRGSSAFVICISLEYSDTKNTKEDTKITKENAKKRVVLFVVLRALCDLHFSGILHKEH